MEDCRDCTAETARKRRCSPTHKHAKAALLTSLALQMSNLSRLPRTTNNLLGRVLNI